MLVHIITLLFGQYYLSFNVLSEILIVSGVLAGFAIYDDYPVNVILSMIFLILISVVRVLSMFFSISINDGDLMMMLFESAGILVIHILISTLACRLILYREQLIETSIYGNRLEQAIGKLTRANTEYQDYLIKIEAESSEKERKRITRDIHDVVGYTLTNNIMLMEAATDMARMNPIGLTKLLNTARENAQEGLEQIRESLYSYRRETDFIPYGLNAVNKLIKTFELATGIKVETDYCNTPLTVSIDIDSVIYHVVQESIINALRHGKATSIRIQMNIHDVGIHVYVHDNGNGIDDSSGNVHKGIGLKGMEERLTNVGGDLSFGNVIDGFLVQVSIPIQTRRLQMM